MTTSDHGVAQPLASAPGFSAWSPLVAVLGALIAESSPGWVTTLVWAIAVLCALPFRRFRLVVPLALLTWAAGWLVSFVLRLTEAGLIGLFVVK
jgi:hypothetical protein